MKMLLRNSRSALGSLRGSPEKGSDDADGNPPEPIEFDVGEVCGDEEANTTKPQSPDGGGNNLQQRFSESFKNRTRRNSTGSTRKPPNNNNSDASPQPQQSPEQAAQAPPQKGRKNRSGRSGRGRSRVTAAEEVLAVDSYNMSVESSSSQQENKQIHSASDIYRNLAGYPRSGGRRNKKSIAPLPTLNEAAKEDDESTVAGSAAQDDHSSFDSWDESNLSFEHADSPQRQQQQNQAQSQLEQDEDLQPIGEVDGLPSKENDAKSGIKTTPSVQPTVMQMLAMDEHKKAVDQINVMMEEATGLGAEGKEDDSIQKYKAALQIGRQDVTRIKGQLVKKTHLSNTFYEDWLEIGLLLAQIRTCQANLHERLLDYSHAIACVQEATSIHRRQASFHKPRSKEKALKSMKTIQKLEAMVSRFQTAKKHDAKRKQVHEEILLFQNEAAAATTPAEKRAAYQKMQDTANHLKSLETRVFGDQHPLVADANSLLGAISLEQGNVDEAIEYMKQALSLMKKALGMKHPRTGTKLLHLASVYASQGRDGTAIDHYNMAIAVFRSCSATKLVGSTLNDVAVIHIRQKEFEEAIVLLNDSLTAYRAGESSWDTAQVWRNLGECYCQRKEYSDGSTALQNALNVQRDGRALLDKAMSSSEPTPDNVPPMHLVDDVSIADTLRRLGKAHYGAREFEPALSYFKEACLIHKAEVKRVVHVSRSSTNVNLPARQDELAQTIYCMAELYDQMGEYDQAAKLFSESLQLRLFSDAHKATRSNMVHCAMCLYGLGGIHLKRGEYEDAQAVIHQALSYCDAHGVPENNVIYAMIKGRLDEAERGIREAEEGEDALHESQESTESSSVDEDTSEIDALELKAAKAIRDGNLEAAVLFLSKAMQRRKVLLQTLKEKGHKAKSIKYDTACTLYTFGKVLVMRGDCESAEKAFKDAIKLFKKSGTSPDSGVVQRLCEELKKLLVSRDKEQKEKKPASPPPEEA